MCRNFGPILIKITILGRIRNLYKSKVSIEIVFKIKIFRLESKSIFLFGNLENCWLNSIFFVIFTIFDLDFDQNLDSNEFFYFHKILLFGQDVFY